MDNIIRGEESEPNLEEKLNINNQSLGIEDLESLQLYTSSRFLQALHMHCTKLNKINVDTSAH